MNLVPYSTSSTLSWLPRLGCCSVLACCTMLAVGCDNEESPATEQLEDGLDKASDAIDELRAESKDKAAELNEMQQDIEAAATRQVNLMSTRLDTFSNQITRLPAEKEREFLDRLTELENQAEAVRQDLSNYANGGENSPTWDAVKQKLEDVKARFESFASELESALQ